MFAEGAETVAALLAFSWARLKRIHDRDAGPLIVRHIAGDNRQLERGRGAGSVLI
jgi:hypothetical protein